MSSNMFLSGPANPEMLTYREEDLPDGSKRLSPFRKSSEFQLKFRPWKVTLSIYPEEHPKKIYDTEYYIRAGNPQDAVAAADRFFQKWEKEVFQPSWPWPDTNGAARAVCVDEQDFFKALKDATKIEQQGKLSKGIFRYFGDRANPTCFVVYPDGWPKVWHPMIKAFQNREKSTLFKI